MEPTAKDRTAMLKTLSESWHKLMDRIFAAREALTKAYRDNASHDDVQVLRDEIESLEKRLARCERMQESL